MYICLLVVKGFDRKRDPIFKVHFAYSSQNVDHIHLINAYNNVRTRPSEP